MNSNLKSKSTNIHKLALDSQLVCTNDSIASGLNQHFSKIGEHLNSQLPNTDLSDIDQFMTAVNDTFNFSLVSPADIVACSKSMKASMAGSLDSCPSKLLIIMDSIPYPYLTSLT